ncbi:MAG: ribose-phosphate diphosphokinase [Anaerolineae bacterium]|nr:ribose-phosphate diphosphokinase [Anaerolineae bacterium]
MAGANTHRFDSDGVLLFGGLSHPDLADEIVDYLGIERSPSSVTRFSNDNFEVQLGVSVRKKDVFILQTLVAPVSDNLLELLMMLDIARTSGARSVHAIVPYYSYARSDKKDAPRISVAGRLIADLMIESGAQHIITMTLHSPQVHGFFNIHTDHLTAHSVFVDYFKQQDLSNCVVVSPDIGNAKRASKLARSLNVPLAIAEKKRLSDRSVEVTSILGEVRGKRVLLTDDEIATGGTILTVQGILKDHGAGPVTIVSTHGLFTGQAAARFDAVDDIDEIVVTDTVPLPPEHRPERLTVLSVGHIFGEVIRRTIMGESVGELFEFWPDT